VLAVECSVIAHLCSHLFCLTCEGLNPVIKVLASVGEQRQPCKSRLSARLPIPGRAALGGGRRDGRLSLPASRPPGGGG